MITLRTLPQRLLLKEKITGGLKNGLGMKVKERNQKGNEEKKNE